MVQLLACPRQTKECQAEKPQNQSPSRDQANARQVKSPVQRYNEEWRRNGDRFAVQRMAAMYEPGPHQVGALVVGKTEGI